MSGALAVLWDDILDLADDLPRDGWVLVGGQMVMLHALAAGRTPTRASQDIDLLANLITRSDAVRRCVHAVRRLGFEPVEANDRQLLHRFIRPADRAVVDILAPDHAPPGWRPVTVPPRLTIKIDGGRQAVDRAVLVEVLTAERTQRVPVPSVLGALVLKGAAYQVDNRDADRHLEDAALLASLIADPLAARDELKGSDRRRLRALDRQLNDPEHVGWRRLGEHRDAALATWKLLTDGLY